MIRFARGRLRSLVVGVGFAATLLAAGLGGIVPVGHAAADTLVQVFPIRR
jgi:hypothetical protein